MIAAHNGLAGGVFTIEGAQLGDWICSPAEGAAGEAAVRQMVQVIDSLRQQGRAAPYEAAAQAIYASYEKEWGNRWVNLSYCGVRDIGRQAQALRDRMLAETASAPVGQNLTQPSPVDVPPLLATVGKYALIGLALVGGVYAVAHFTPVGRTIMRVRGARR